MMRKNFLLLASILFSLYSLSAQEEKKSDWQTKLEKLNITTSINLQMWAVYTNGTEVYNTGLEAYEKVGDRLNFSLHRSRYGVTMQPYKNLKFNFTFAADFVGRDALSGQDVGQNNGGNPAFRLWKTFLQLRMKSGSEKAYLTFGYFLPQIGRESITNPLRSTSMEKAWSQNYLRRQVHGVGSGRAPGMNFGGLFYKDGHKISFQYDLGLYSPIYQAYGGNSTGKQASPMAMGRAVVMFGDPESKKYGLGAKPNYFGKRNGLSIGLALAQQGHTDLFDFNRTYGVDFLFNYGQLNLDGEWHNFTRQIAGGEAESKANTGYVRLSYNLPLHFNYVLEPVVMFSKYNGEMKAEGQATAAKTGMPAGEDQYVDFGFNFYFNPDLKLALHYTMREGHAGDVGAGSTINNYFVSGAGPIRHGDWLGLGLSAIF